MPSRVTQTLDPNKVSTTRHARGGGTNVQEPVHSPGCSAFRSGLRNHRRATKTGTGTRSGPCSRSGAHAAARAAAAGTRAEAGTEARGEAQAGGREGDL